MKFLNFFRTTAGIITLLVIAAIILLVIFNWAAISAWWNDETPAGETGGTGDTGGTGTNDRGRVNPRPSNPVFSPKNPCIDSNGGAVCGDLACVNIGGTAYCLPKRN